MEDFSAGMVLSGYLQGVFPMAESDGTIYWYAPDPRCIIPLETYKPARSLRPVLNRRTFEIQTPSSWERGMAHCRITASKAVLILISKVRRLSTGRSERAGL